MKARIFLAALALASVLRGDDLAQFARRAEMNPKDPAAQFNYAVMAFKSKDLKAAHKAVKRVTELAPDDAVAWELLGQVEIERGEEKAALAAAEKSAGLNPKSLRSQVLIGKIYSKREDKDSSRKALHAYEAAAKLGPKDPSHLINQGVLLSRMGDDKKALDRFEKAAKLPGGQALTGRYLCQLYNKTGDYKRAKAACLAAAKDPAAGAETHYNLGYALSRLEDKKGARKSFEAAVAKDADFAPALYNLGLQYYYDEQKLDEALAKFKAALEARQGNYPEAQYNIAVILGEQGKWMEAAQLYREILKKDPANDDAKTNLAYVVETGAEALLGQGKDAYENGNFDAASKAWGAVLELDPENSNAKEFLAKVKKSSPANDTVLAAKKEARKAVVSKLKTQDEKVLKDGLAAAKAGKLSEAVRLLDFYLKKNPGNKAASQALFKARSSQRQKVDDLLQVAGRKLGEGDKAAAKAATLQALALEPGNSRANRMLSQVTGSEGAQKTSAEQLKKEYFGGVDAYLDGNLPKAIGIWKKVLSQDPGHLDARRSLSQAELELVALKKHK